jgi:hypothetical protein
MIPRNYEAVSPLVATMGADMATISRSCGGGGVARLRSHSLMNSDAVCLIVPGALASRLSTGQESSSSLEGVPTLDSAGLTAAVAGSDAFAGAVDVLRDRPN